MRSLRIKGCSSRGRLPQLLVTCLLLGLLFMLLSVHPSKRQIVVSTSEIPQEVDKDSVDPSLIRERFDDMLSFGAITSGSYIVEPNTTLCSLQQRTQNVAEMCIKAGSPHGQKLDGVDKDELPNHLLVDDKHGILYCDLSLAASDTWLPLFVLASDPVKAEIYNDMLLPVDDHYLLDYGLRRLHMYDKGERKRMLNNYIKFIVLRHPYDRLVAAWRAHEEFLSFEDFIRKVTKLGSSGDRTWLTLNSCKPCLVKYDYISRVETSWVDSKLLKLLLGVDYYIPKTRERKYTTQKTLNQYKNISSQLMAQINDMYAADTRLFGYHFDPHTLRTSCEFEGKRCC